MTIFCFARGAGKLHIIFDTAVLGIYLIEIGGAAPKCLFAIGDIRQVRS